MTYNRRTTLREFYEAQRKHEAKLYMEYNYARRSIELGISSRIQKESEIKEIEETWKFEASRDFPLYQLLVFGENTESIYIPLDERKPNLLDNNTEITDNFIFQASQKAMAKIQRDKPVQDSSKEALKSAELFLEKNKKILKNIDCGNEYLNHLTTWEEFSSKILQEDFIDNNIDLDKIARNFLRRKTGPIKEGGISHLIQEILESTDPAYRMEKSFRKVLQKLEANKKEESPF